MHNQSNRNLWHNCKSNNKAENNKKQPPLNCEQKDLAGCLCPSLDECHGNVLIELVHEFFPSESEMRGYILCHQYLFFKGQSSPLSNCYAHNIKMQDGAFINVHQIYG